MIKVKKISLQNFKGIKPLTVFSFDSDDANVNILAGPNGFGKTTIFDVIEICLTGEFKRLNLFDGVQRKNLAKNKPFFQNTKGEDVILKLWLENKRDNTEYIIIKHYDVLRSPRRVAFGRDFIPSDGHNLLLTYLETDPTAFTTSNYSQFTRRDQKEINNIFFSNNTRISLSSTFYLFNYIQQEDSIYFLRQSEDDKGVQLGFLFNIENEEQEKQKVGNIRTRLLDQRIALSQQISILRDSIPNASEVRYQRIFEKEFEFDKENPFSQIDTTREKLSSMESTINSLIVFRNEFSIVDFENSVKYKKLNEQVLGNESILESLVLREVYDTDLIKRIETINSKIASANEFLVKNPVSIIEKKYFDLFLPDEQEINAFRSLTDRLSSLDKDLGAVGHIISELNEYRAGVYREFQKLTKSLSEQIAAENCPLCDTAFPSAEDLSYSIATKDQALSSFNQAKLNERKLLIEQTREINLKIAANANKYLAENKSIENTVVSVIRNLSNTESQITQILNEFPALQGAEIQIFSLQSFPGAIEELVEAKTKLRDYISKNILPQFAFDEARIVNKAFYQEYFDGSSAVFNSITADLLTSKVQYLRSKYTNLANERMQFLGGRMEKLDGVLEKINSVYEKVHRTIQDHKAEMIERIKIPFYIYSGKILQSYQQGLGIFIDIRPTGQSNNVQFKTGHSSDHDIVYHLSSGQKAVVSLAFCLSLNKVYSTTQHFKFLSIDDPIQTMDDLNVHTFIELVRNEFSDYQIVMSTHDDFTSRYMKYKFDKFDMKTKIQNVQKIVLEQTPS